MGITQEDKLTNKEVLQRTGQRRLQDTVAKRRFRFAGHIIRLPQERPAHCAMDTPEGVGGRRAGEREEDQRRHGGQHSNRTYNYVESAGVKQKQQQNVQDGNILQLIVMQRIGATKCSKY